ncbi:oxidoreductase [Amycolatopsis albispora]|uniref:Protochlorophyllide oxidoreductase n=1 Tax=Amycolatopsis albispora TaxID=1804986 RepID=A0A344L7Z0_9PSEU|nr:oxidoreductase [Amycolatopsis albispora]AXB44164.1 protochlorophyllide oxidoreductase [Amycolatopsis albispora]
MSKWTEADIPAQDGRTVVITGANSGLGLRSAVVLAEKGARVLLACRSPERGQRALGEVAEVATGPAPELVRLDLASLASVREAAGEIRKATGDSLDVLLNNAGLMAPPKGHTVDGFETQFGTNHLGHAALTWLLMPALRGSDGVARVVTLSSVAATGGRIDLDDPNYETRRYFPWTAYGQSKLANQVFALELDRRLRAAGEPVLSVAAHPGYTRSGLSSGMANAQRNAVLRAVVGAGAGLSERLLAQNTRMGTLPQLYAATAPEVEGGAYYGPDGFGGTRGFPARVRPLGPARDEPLGAGLWQLTAEMTGVTPDPA